MSIERYARARQIELAQAMASRAKVYLDVRFWIYGRDVAAGTETDPHLVELLGLLRAGVAEGKLVCPVGATTFIEVMKQANTETRRKATARLIDELSLGLSITEERGRIGTEIAHFFYQASGAYELHDMAELVWTKLSFSLGLIFPNPQGLDAATAADLQRQVFEDMWQTPLELIVDGIGDRWARSDELKRAAQQINADIKQHAPALVSYPATYREEIVGCLDICQAMCAETMADMAERNGVQAAEPGSPSWTQAGRMGANLLIAAFEKPETKLALRTVHAMASCHAGLRWDRQTNFTENHAYDFEHAAAAVAYCDAFLTEGFLAKLINDGHIRLDQLNGCRTTASKEEAANIVRGLAQAKGGP
jgi:hypothetical protein